MKMALQGVRTIPREVVAQSGRLRGEAVQHPHKSKRPPNRGVAAQTVPVEQEICAGLLASNYRCEDYKNRGACIVGKLQEDDLGEYSGWG
jgi:hypothetical protein